MERLIILGCLCILIVNAQDVVNDIKVEYAKVTKTNVDRAEKLIISLCNVNVPDATVENSVAVLTIQQKGENPNPDDGENINGKKEGDCLEFDFSDHPQFMKVQNDIFLKVIVTTPDIEGKIKKEAIHEFKGKFTFTETNTEKVVFKLYQSVNIIQFTNGDVPIFKVIKDSETIIAPKSITCGGDPVICIHPADKPLEKNQEVEIYNAVDDTIPISSPITIGDNNIIATCKEFTDIFIVYDNDDTKNGYTFTGNDATKACAVSGTEVFYNLVGNIKPNPTPETFVVIHNDNCELITAKVRTMTFLDPFSKTVEVSWTKDTDQYYLEVLGTVNKNLHIDCKGIDLNGTCIAYVFDNKMSTDAITYQLSEASEQTEPQAYIAGKSKTKQTYEHKEPNSGGQKSLKALNLNQFEINWNTKQGKLCVEDALYENNKKSQFRYELVIGFDDGNWKKHIANYNDESTICFNDFEITQLIENKLGVHFLVMKRGSDTNQIVASDMITTDLIVPEISEVNDETISLEFENLNSPFLIRDEKTKNIISKNEKKIHNLAFLKSSHENKSLFNRNLVLETRKEHTQMKVHFKIPQKVNAA